MKRLLKKTQQEFYLFIVDVQREFIDYINQELLDDMKKYVENNNWDKIIVVVDDNKDTCYIPDWVKSKASLIIHKKFGGIRNADIHRGLHEGTIEEVGNNSYRYSNNGNYIVYTANQHENFVVPKELEELASSLSGKKVTLIGGADGECLADINAALQFFGVKTEINNNLTYAYYDKQKFVENENTVNNWIDVKKGNNNAK